MPVYQVLPAKLPDVWGAVDHLLGSACDGSAGRFTLKDLVAKLVSGEFQLWIAVALDDDKVLAAGVTRLLQYPQFRVCEILVCVGQNMEAWVDDISTVEDWARSQGCKQMMPIARRGWERVLRAKGYNASHVVLEKDL